jgi:opacity protein-like surface antigen
MKHILILLFLVAPCVVFGETDKQNWKPYLGANMGLSASDVTAHSEDFFDFGGVFNFEAGARYKTRYRIALNYQSRAEVSELFQILFGHVIAIKNDAIRVNGYYDYVSTRHFAMYIGGGIGGDIYDYKITNRYDNSTIKKHGIAFTAGAMTGISFNFWRMGIDLGFAFDYIANPQIYSYGPNLGLRFNF